MVMGFEPRDPRGMRWLGFVVALTACGGSPTAPATTATATSTSASRPAPSASTSATPSATALDGGAPTVGRSGGLNELGRVQTVVLACGEREPWDPNGTHYAIYVQAPCAETTVTANGLSSDQARLAVSAGAFRYCGETAVYGTPTAQGSVRFDVHIDGRGETTSITVSERTGTLTDGEVECAKKKLDAMDFDKGPRVLTVTFTQKIAPGTGH